MGDKSQKWDWRPFGKAWAVVGEILNKVRAVSETDGGLDWEFLEWLSKAPYTVYDRVYRELINAWQDDVATKRNLEFRFSHDLTTPAQAELWCASQPGRGWKMPLIVDLAKLIIQGADLPPTSHYWFREEDETIGIACLISNGGVRPVERSFTGACRAICVREKPKRMTVSVPEQVNRLLDGKSPR